MASGCFYERTHFTSNSHGLSYHNAFAFALFSAWNPISISQISISLGSPILIACLQKLLCTPGRIHQIVYPVKALYFALFQSIHHTAI
jgi:hypothetical protein